MRKTCGTLLIVLGAVMIVSAGILIGHHLLSQHRAEQNVRTALAEIEIPVSVAKTDSSMTAPVPHYVLNPEMGMPEQKIKGIAYIGLLEIPALELSLPIISTTTGAYLQIAPCRFSGSAYMDDLVIGAHNYSAHFGRIGELSYGDQVKFTDMDGNSFTYQVADIEILQPDQSELLCSGEWPLSLYTCTVGGRTRVTVRCDTAEGY